MAAWGALLGCGSSASSPPPPPPPPAPLTGDAGIGDVVYVGQATDDALLRMLDLPASDTAAYRLTIASPAAGAALPGGAPGSFAYAPLSALEAGPPRRTVAAAAARRGLVEGLIQLAHLLGPIRPAYAHGPPFNGTGYFLVVSDPSGSPLLRVFTDQLSFTPSAAQWATLAAAPQPLNLAITWAQFDQNQVPDGAGPFVGGSVQFRVD